MRTNPLSKSLLALLALILLTTPLVAESPHQLREQMRPTWEALQTDIEYLALKKQLEGNLDNREVVDRYLRYLPMSPMLMLDIDMQVNHYEIVVPRIMAEWHQRWIKLNELKARNIYGDDYVDGRLNLAWGDDETATGVPTKATVGTNRNAAATNSPAPEDYQGEIQMMVNPNNANQIVAAANTWDDMSGTCGDYGMQAVFYSSDGGDTWGYSCPPDASAYSMSCSGGTFGSDPAVYWNDSGDVFLEYMLLCYTGNYYYSIVVAKSTNGGASWSAQGVVVDSFSSGVLEDKNFYAIDNNSSSPYYGRHYTCWDRSNNEKSAYSTNEGQSWTEVDLPSSGGTELGCEIAVEDDGTVHVIFDSLTCTATCSNERMFYTRSTNGGASWSSPVLVRDFNLVGFSNANCPDAQDDRCIGPMGAIDVDNTGGSCDGILYATFGDYSGGEDVNDTDVWVSRSTNDGASWSSPVKVNDDGLANRVQFHPYLWVDQSNGSVVVAWHDARNDAGNDAVDYYVARSTDCGLSFETNVQASQPSSEFNNSTISYSNENSSDNSNYNGNQYGEYMGLDVNNGTAYLAWADTRHFFPAYTTETQAENMGFAKVEFVDAVCGNDTIESPEVCDGTDLDGETCVSQGFLSGTLTCESTCDAFDTSSCVAPVCGNNVQEGYEVCDGTDLDGETCVSLGFSGGTLACGGSCDAFDTSSCTSAVVEVTFTSVASQDGWIRESSETSNVGGLADYNDYDADALRVGDARFDRQLKSVVSFDTSSIPDGATILSATLRLRRGRLVGTNPFTILGTCYADISSAFSGSTTLQTSDFQAAAAASQVATMSNPTSDGAWSEGTLNASGRAAVNKTGTTQLRVYFSTDDNDDRGDDYMGYYAGDDSTAEDRPQLVIEYQ